MHTASVATKFVLDEFPRFIRNCICRDSHPLVLYITHVLRRAEINHYPWSARVSVRSSKVVGALRVRFIYRRAAACSPKGDVHVLKTSTMGPERRLGRCTVHSRSNSSGGDNWKRVWCHVCVWMYSGFHERRGTFPLRVGRWRVWAVLTHAAGLTAVAVQPLPHASRASDRAVASSAESVHGKDRPWLTLRPNIRRNVVATSFVSSRHLTHCLLFFPPRSTWDRNDRRMRSRNAHRAQLSRLGVAITRSRTYCRRATQFGPF